MWMKFGYEYGSVCKEVMWMKHESQLEFLVLRVFQVLDQWRRWRVKATIVMAISRQYICWVNPRQQNELKVLFFCWSDGIGRGRSCV